MTRTMLRLAAPFLSVLFLAAGAESAQEEEIYLLAKTSKQIEKNEALDLVRSGKYKMTQIDEGDVLRALLYQSPSDLEDHMPPHIIEVMTRRDSGDAPGSEWLGEPLPDFSGEDEQGRLVSTAGLRGKVAVVNYWFIACKPCVVEMPALSRLQRRFAEREDVEFLALTFDTAEKVADFLSDREFTYRQISLANEWFSKAGIVAYPTHLVVDRSGVIRGAVEGLGSTEELEEELTRLVDEALAGGGE